MKEKECKYHLIPPRPPIHLSLHAILYYDKAIELNSRYAESYCNRGVSRAESGNYKGAISDFNKSINVKPELTIAFFNKANIKRKLYGEKVAWNALERIWFDSCI